MADGKQKLQSPEIAEDGWKIGGWPQVRRGFRTGGSPRGGLGKGDAQ